MSDTLQARLAEALAPLANPRTGASLYQTQQVRDIAVTRDGKVRVTLLLAANDDPTLARQVRQALERVDGVAEVRVDVKDSAEPAPGGQYAPEGKPNHVAKARALPVMGEQAPPRTPATPQPVAYPQLGRIIAVSSGKGGVGKSTVTTNLAISLAKQGYHVGLMDADIYGPNIPRMMGVDEAPPVVDDKIQPLVAHGVKVISLGFLIERDQPAIWRGPIVMKIITQFLRDVNWGRLDFLFVDMPPGTGDAQLSLVQATQVAGAIIVTTPQEVAVGDALRGAKMFQRVGVPVLGVVENMSYFESPETGKPMAIFGTGGGKRLADELEVPLLGEVPLYPPVLEGADRGAPIVVSGPESTAARKLTEIAGRIVSALGVGAPA
ncbi:MAG: Mrp/NBP35 family ATP-binding protein [Gemmatimonadaceae bacterium]|nr:Mrp/NBP35 family ATP-binding protein [Gemmatimonadaceae bacterium]MCW5826803.1 Mrp/NBP35 family ATP-binding protein [Gemmatimonadaceae bacterium]